MLISHHNLIIFVMNAKCAIQRYIGKRGHRHRTMDAGQRTPDNGCRTNDGKDGQRWKRRTTMEKTDNDGKDGQRWKRRTNDGKDGQTMEKTDKRWKRRTTMEKTDKRWKRRTNDGKDGQTMEKTDKRWKRRTRFLIHLSSNFGQILVGKI